MTTTQALSVPRAGFGIRLGAYLIDIILIGIIVGLVGPLLGGMAGAALGSSFEESLLGGLIGGAIGIFIAIPVVNILYFLTEAFFGITVGKLMLGLQIAHTDGRKGNIALYLKRYMIKFGLAYLLMLVDLFLLTGILSTIGNIWLLVIFFGCLIAAGASKQALHDKIAKTAVFKRKAIIT